MCSKEYALIITGCVCPKNNVFSLELKDVTDRLNQYIESIEYYIIDTKVENIIFCENSDYNYDYSSLIDVARNNGKQLEIIVYEGNNEQIAKHGKGYGEGEILEYALKHSVLVKKVSFIYKVTGRLIIKNFDDIVDLEDSGSIYFNKNLYSYKTLDTRFWGMPKDLYEDLFIEQYYKVDDKGLRFIEHVFYDTITSTVLEYRQHPFFPIIEGKSGTTNSVYKETIPFYSKWLCFVARKGIFNRRGVYFFSYLFLHWDRCWDELLSWLRSILYHYYAEMMVRLKKGFVLSRTFLYHYYAEMMVRLKKGFVLSRTFFYHYYSEGKVKIKKAFVVSRTVLYHYYAEGREYIKRKLRKKDD